MDDATKVSIEALKRIRDEAKAGKNPRKPKPAKVMRGEGAALLEDVRHFLLRFVIYPSEAQIAHVLWIALAHLMGAWKARQLTCRPSRRRGRRDRWKYRASGT
jgi:hypothetical protein